MEIVFPEKVDETANQWPECGTQATFEHIPEKQLDK
ncbi:hypothetical protein HNR07_001753 [Nocardiopsis metallicus]|uniref:Uncharacterized protein n=1 Tax=Nocardiopsis metallicus TaxID=179819 RepID=A0A840WGT3_9ACTN|nr:hypothetical protein [Nocardiopsis metallicus]